jgi:hypothetical protein
MRRIFIALAAFMAAVVGTPGHAQDRSDSARRIPVTAEHIRTAFRDSAARVILEGARAARLSHDSALLSYDASAYQRISVNLGIGLQGSDRLAHRSETATRIRFHRDIGALVEVEGARSVTPIAMEERRRRDTTRRQPPDVADTPLPYFPGSESLWLGSEVARPDVEEGSIIHPLARGSEAYYQYRRGDSAEYRFPDGTRVRLVELLVMPREPKWNLVVGSFWFDASHFRLVRAAYRLAVPLDMWTVAMEEEDEAGLAVARAFVSPVRGTVTGITIEYALFEQRFWMPIVRTAEGYAHVMFARVPFTLQQKYEYAHVNGPVEIPAIALTPAMARRDSVIMRDSLRAVDDPAARELARLIDERLSAADSTPPVRTTAPTRPRNPCDTLKATARVSRTDNRMTRILTITPCSDSLLASSPRLPPSIYTPVDSVLGASMRDAMMERLRTGLQPAFAPQLPQLTYGLGNGMMRYNRVEGLSPALGVQQSLGAGLALGALARVGTADRRFNGELGASLSDGRRTFRVAGYKRLVATNDWGNPLGFGASFQALLFGRDEGFYYRGTGAELVLSGHQSPYVDLRLYGERQKTAAVATQFSVLDELGSERGFPANIVAEEGDLFGAALRVSHSFGENPQGFRMFTTLRAENGLGDFSFGRGMVDVTLSQGVANLLSLSLSLSAGTSAGHLPVQRQFSVGGTQSVRGQRAGTQFGDAFWMARAEIGDARTAAKRVLFADFGWAGSREDWSHQSRAISGVGFGWSLLDGVLRLEIARGLYPSVSWRFASYLRP